MSDTRSQLPPAVNFPPPDKDTPCLTCGSKEWPNALVCCVSCLGYAVHRYCLPEMLDTFDEFVMWYCDDCEMKRRHKSKTKDFVVMQDQVSEGTQHQVCEVGMQHVLVEYVESPSKSVPTKLSQKHADLMKMMRKRCVSVISDGQGQVNDGSTDHVLVEHVDSPSKSFPTKLSEKHDDLMNIMRKRCLGVSSEGCSSLLPQAKSSVCEDHPEKRRNKRKGMKDEAWIHAKLLNKSGRKTMCMFCRFVSRHGGITRLKAHLAGANPLVPGCPKVSEEVKETMVQWYNERVKINAEGPSSE